MLAENVGITAPAASTSDMEKVRRDERKGEEVIIHTTTERKTA